MNGQAIQGIKSEANRVLYGDNRLLSRVLSGTNPSVRCGDPVLDQELPLPEADEKAYRDFDPSRWY